MKKLISIFMATVIIATIAMSAFAVTPDLVNSIGSVAADSEEAQVIGNDATQNTKVAVVGDTHGRKVNTCLTQNFGYLSEAA